MNYAFKLSFITDEVSQNLEEIEEFAKNFNVEAIEIRTILNKGFPEILEEKVTLKKFLEENNLKVSAIAAPTFKCDVDSREEYEKHIAIFKDALELASYLDTKLVRSFTFWKKGKYEDYKEKIIKKFEKIIELADDYSTTIVVENEPSTFVGNGRMLADFINSLNTKTVRALWDPGNDLMDEEEQENPYPVGFNHVRGMIAHVHLKDGVRENSKVRFLKIGKGQAKIEENLRALKEVSYSGYISLETHWRMTKDLEEAQIKLPGGKEFSSGAYVASYVTMQGLLEVISRIK
ncbi:MAG: sugar phosphate isomerase/epimerase [Candidatus Brockarchaeota archaeon]|nr:sugar phosphate isomerase/epimerase [Candidatus Brockarchaeota archaeon]